MPHIALTSYELETGGISRVAVYLANGFRAAGHRVSLVLCSGEGDLDAVLRKEIHPDIDIVTLSERGSSRRALGQIATLPAMRRWVLQEKPDVLLGTANNISWFTGLATAFARRGQPRLFIKTTNPVLRENDSAMLTRLRRWGYGKLFCHADGVLTLSEQESADLQAAFGDVSIHFVAVANPYVGPEHQRNYSNRKQSGAGATTRKFLFLGRLEPQKNVPRLLRAFAKARSGAGNEANNWSLIIAGEGSMRGECETLAKDLGISGQVDFIGFSTDSAGLLTTADCLILPSNYEGLPAVVPEALASGCPVISTDCFLAAREMLTGLPGCAVVARDDTDLAQAIVEFIPPKDLTPLTLAAERYTFAASVAEHLQAMSL